MNLKPARGYIFVVPVDDIPVSHSTAGFGGKTEKNKPEQPYRFKVVAVGGPRPFEGLLIDSGVDVGDIVSHNSTNGSLREQRETSGFLVDDKWHLPMDFREVLGVWS